VEVSQTWPDGARFSRGLPPAQILDVTGPLEVFASVWEYDVVLGSPHGSNILRTSRGFDLSRRCSTNANFPDQSTRF
jgi:hypothetical protein